MDFIEVKSKTSQTAFEDGPTKKWFVEYNEELMTFNADSYGGSCSTGMFDNKLDALEFAENWKNELEERNHDVEMEIQ